MARPVMTHRALVGVAVSGIHDRWPRTRGADRVGECAARTTAPAVSIGIEIMRTHDRGRPHMIRAAIRVVRLQPHHRTHYDVSVVGGRKLYDVRVGKAHGVKSAINTKGRLRSPRRVRVSATTTVLAHAQVDSRPPQGSEKTRTPLLDRYRFPSGHLGACRAGAGDVYAG